MLRVTLRITKVLVSIFIGVIGETINVYPPIETPEKILFPMAYTSGQAFAETNTPQFWYGLNYPWLNYGGDFGQAAWPQGAWEHAGISAHKSQQQVEKDFAYLRSNGISIVRWFMFADGRASPEFNGDGYVTGLDNYFNADLETALSLACKYDLQIILVLLDFKWMKKTKTIDGVRLGGHTDVIADIDKRRSFFVNALLPVLKRYGQDKRIHAWDVINQPEWAIEEVSGGGSNLVNVPIGVMQSFVRDVVELIHQNAIQKVTVGTARGNWLTHWREMKLDLYQFHHYGEHGAVPPFVSATNMKLDKPIILGEFPTKGGEVAPVNYLSQALENGYAGALGWSLNANDEYSGFTSPATSKALKQWLRSHEVAASVECQ
jgi:hypothetical protein